MLASLLLLNKNAWRQHPDALCATNWLQVTERVLAATVSRLWHHGVLLEGCLLKPQMVIPGADCPGGKATPEQIAKHTVEALRRCGEGAGSCRDWDGAPPMQAGNAFKAAELADVHARMVLCS